MNLLQNVQVKYYIYQLKIIEQYIKWIIKVTAKNMLSCDAFFHIIIATVKEWKKKQLNMYINRYIPLCQLYLYSRKPYNTLLDLLP